jgi:hypothetical protein
MGDSNSLLGGWAASNKRSCQPLATEYPSRFNHPLSDWRAVAFLAAPKGLAEVPDPSPRLACFAVLVNRFRLVALAIGRPVICRFEPPKNNDPLPYIGLRRYPPQKACKTGHFFPHQSWSRV